MKRVLSFALATLVFSGCFCGFPFPFPQEDGGTEEEGEQCLGTPLQQCKDWRCGGQGQVISRVPAAGTTAVTGTLSGQLLANLFLVDFSVTTTNGTTVATYKTPDLPCEDLVVTLTDAGSASFTWRGSTFTGIGALDANQQAALADLRNSPYIGAVVVTPLELGCHPDLSDAQVATLLFPFQVLLKYDPTPNTRAAALEAIGRESKCSYWGKRRDLENSETVDGTKILGPLQFAPSNLIPHVVGIFPLDAAGATEASGQPLEGDLTGPCGGKCRGACGPDCPDTCTAMSVTECASDGGVDQAVEVYDCGVHNGCVEHDDCYDACYLTNACDSWGAAMCRRGCDSDAVSDYGIRNTSSWARGGGPFLRRVEFRYKTPDPGACSCVAQGTEVTLEDGSTRAIESLSQGEGILAFDEHTGAVIKASIELVLVHQGPTYTFDQLRSASGEELELTANHPVFTQRGFVKTEELVVGDTLFIIDHVARQTRQEILVSIVRKSSTANVSYNLKTTAGNYFAADLLIHNKCLAGESLLETPKGFVAISSLRAGDVVRGVEAGERVWTTVRAVYRKSTVLPSLPGRQLGETARVTDNHVLSLLDVAAGELDLPRVEIEGAVFDLQTDTGNFLVGDVLLEAGR